MTWSYIDIFLLIPFLYGIVRGFIKGFVFVMISMASLFLAIFLAIKLSDMLAIYMVKNGWISENLSYIVSFLLITISVIILLILIGKILEKILKTLQLNWLNRVAGALAGGVQFLLITLLMLHYIEKIDNTLPFLPKDVKEKSLLWEKMIQCKNKTGNFLFNSSSLFIKE